MLGANRSRLLVALAGGALAGCALLAPAPPLGPFRDVAEVVAIERVGDRIRFETPNGELLFDPRDESWVVRATEQAGEPPERDLQGLDVRDPRADALLPPWWPRPTYGAIVATAQERGPWLLVRRFGEGADYTDDDVVDVAGVTRYTFQAQDARALLVTPEDVWIGHARGVTRVRRATGRRSDYVALPSIRAISGWVEHAGVRYVATPEGALLAIRASGEVASIQLPVDLVLAHDAAWGWRRSERSDDVHWRLTNPLLLGGRLYLGAFATTLHGLWGRSESFLLAYELGSRTWSVRLLPPSMRVRHVFEHAGRIWMIGNWFEAGEGGEFAEYGGIAMLTPDGRIVALERCAERPVRSWRTDETRLWFLGATWDDAVTRYAECRLELEETAFGFPAWYPLTPESPSIRRYPERSFELPLAEQEALSAWRVRHRVVERTDRSLAVERYPESTASTQ